MVSILQVLRRSSNRSVTGFVVRHATAIMQRPEQTCFKASALHACSKIERLSHGQLWHVEVHLGNKHTVLRPIGSNIKCPCRMCLPECRCLLQMSPQGRQEYLELGNSFL